MHRKHQREHRYRGYRMIGDVAPEIHRISNVTPLDDYCKSALPIEIRLANIGR
jgi:hypothetical protein